MTDRTKLLIADDHPVVRSGLRGMLESQPDFYVIAEAGDGAEAVRLVERLRPDVVLMDLRMPKMDGVAAIHKIKADHPETNVVVLTTYESDADILKAVEAGATGYLLKDTPPEGLYGAIRAASDGRAHLASAVAARLMERVRRPARETLSGREIEIIELVARGTSNKEIAKRLWIGETTVKTHMVHILDKLSVPDRTAAVTEALKRGIIRLEP